MSTYCNHIKKLKQLNFTVSLKKIMRKTSRNFFLVFFTAVYSYTLFYAHCAHAQYVGRISSIVMDVNGRVLSEQDADLKRFPASLTKMMTLYMAFRALNANAIRFDQRIPITIHAASMEPSKLGVRPGSYITVREAVLGLITKSANDAASALGEFIGGGDEERFAKMMTQQAKVLGMNRTRFYNASGLPNPGQLTTARDLAILAQHLISDFPQYYPLFRTPYFYFRGRTIPNHDPLLKGYAGADGLKTGYTAAAGHNLVGSAVHDNVRLIGVVMGAPSNGSRNQYMMSALDDGFAKSGVAPVARPVYLARTNSLKKHPRYNKHPKVILVRAARTTRGKKSVEVAQASSRTSIAKKRDSIFKRNIKKAAVRHHTTSRHNRKK